MKPKQRHITDTELAVLKVLWDRGPSPARSIVEELYPQCSESDVGTIHSMLQRLEGKQLVTRDRSARPHLFSAKVTRTEVAGEQLETLADRLSDGSLAPFLTHLVQTRRLTDDEIAEIRRLIDQSVRKSKS